MGDRRGDDWEHSPYREQSPSVSEPMLFANWRSDKVSVLRKTDLLYTYEDYTKFPNDGTRWELIDGVPYAMASPTWRHQAVLGLLYWKLQTHLQMHEKCKVIIAPFDVKLNADKGDDTVVQPDLIVVCDPKKIKKNFMEGAPDLVIEVLSPSTAKHDLRVKFAKYREAGVKEVWFVDVDGVISTYRLNVTGEYDGNIYGAEDEIPVGILTDFMISGKDIFDTLEEEKEL